jgi:hypothetical protein
MKFAKSMQELWAGQARGRVEPPEIGAHMYIGDQPVTVAHVDSRGVTVVMGHEIHIARVTVEDLAPESRLNPQP